MIVNLGASDMNSMKHYSTIVLFATSIGCSGGASTPDASIAVDALVADASVPDASPLPVFDCANLPTAPTSVRLLDGARGYHGLAITPAGDMLGTESGGSLVRANYSGESSAFIPNTGIGEQMDWQGDGSLAMASDDGLVRITLSGEVSNIAPNVYAYGVVVGPDKMIYVTDDSAALVRINPANGATETLLEGVDFGQGPGLEQARHSLAFSRDGRRIFIGLITYEGAGEVHYVDLDADMNVVGEEKVFATGVGETGQGGWHDAVGVDACGNLYIPDYFSSNIYRVSQSGEVSVFWSPPQQEHYAHGLVWGTGEHGWRRDALYVPQPYNNHSVTELVIGIPSKDYPGEVLNRP